MSTATMTDMEWQRRAACRGMNRNLFFPEYAWLVDPAVAAACDGCPVRGECLSWALETDQEFGIWGGLTETQRDQIKKTKSRVRCPDCRGSNIIEDGHSEICLSCGLSWSV